MTKNIIVGFMVLLFSLVLIYTLIICSVYFTLTSNYKLVSTDILCEDALVQSDDWFAYQYYLKFNMPEGKHYYISNFDGLIGKICENSRNQLFCQEHVLEEKVIEDDEYEDTVETEEQDVQHTKKNRLNESGVVSEVKKGLKNYTTEKDKLEEPYVSFVWLNRRLYDIYLKYDGIPFISKSSI